MYRLLIIALLLIGCDSTHFESKDWIEGDYLQRGKMMDDLLQRGILEGKTRDEVLTLLGTPVTEMEGCLTYLYADDKVIYWTYRFDICFDDKSGTFKKHFITD